VREIAAIVGVSRSSVSHWVRDIELTDAQRDALRMRDPRYNAHLAGSRANAERALERRRRYQEEGRERARRAGRLYVAGCMLLWAEGSRRRAQVQLANSDPELVRLFVRFLRSCFQVPDEAMRVTCNLFADHSARQEEIEQHWLDALELPRSCLCKSIVNVYSKHSQKKRRNKLPYGTCRVTVHSTELAQTLYGSIQELGGFDRPEWLELIRP
jgi:hypothetical protein